MKRITLHSTWLRVVVVAATALFGWVLFVYISNLPLRQATYYGCPICRAGKTVISCFLIPVNIKFNDNEFSRYYRSNADPKHRHIWLVCNFYRESRSGNLNGDGSPSLLNYRAALAILKALPDRKSRKTFFEQLYVAEKSTPEGETTYANNIKAISKLNEAYFENRQRTDWLVQLRKVGLYPNTVSNKH